MLRILKSRDIAYLGVYANGDQGTKPGYRHEIPDVWVLTGSHYEFFISIFSFILDVIEEFQHFRNIWIPNGKKLLAMLLCEDIAGIDAGLVVCDLYTFSFQDGMNSVLHPYLLIGIKSAATCQLAKGPDVSRWHPAQRERSELVCIGKEAGVYFIALLAEYPADIKGVAEYRGQSLFCEQIIYPFGDPGGLDDDSGTLVLLGQFRQFDGC